MDDRVGDRFAHRSFDIADLLKRRIQLRGKCGNCRSGKALVDAAAQKLHGYVIIRLHFHFPFSSSKMGTIRVIPAASKTFFACGGTLHSAAFPPNAVI